MLELALSLRFKNLGVGISKQNYERSNFHSQIFQNYEWKNDPLTVIPVSIHRKASKSVKVLE